MSRPIALTIAVLFPLLAYAQESGQMDHSQMNHDAMVQTSVAGKLTEGGQGAFAAIAEIVDLLETDPATDWTRVDIEGLRQHLIDMDNVICARKWTPKCRKARWHTLSHQRTWPCKRRSAG